MEIAGAIPGELGILIGDLMINDLFDSGIFSVPVMRIFFDRIMRTDYGLRKNIRAVGNKISGPGKFSAMSAQRRPVHREICRVSQHAR